MDPIQRKGHNNVSGGMGARIYTWWTFQIISSGQVPSNKDAINREMAPSLSLSKFAAFATTLSSRKAPKSTCSERA